MKKQRLIELLRDEKKASSNLRKEIEIAKLDRLNDCLKRVSEELEIFGEVTFVNKLSQRTISSPQGTFERTFTFELKATF